LCVNPEYAVDETLPLLVRNYSKHVREIIRELDGAYVTEVVVRRRDSCGFITDFGRSLIGMKIAYGQFVLHHRITGDFKYLIFGMARRQGGANCAQPATLVELG
jgi:hypothetical protein